MPNPSTPTESALAGSAWARNRLSVSRTTLITLEKTNKLHPVKLPSGHRRYLIAEVEALAAGTTASEASPRASEVHPAAGGAA
jgi:hypothetical protein